MLSKEKCVQSIKKWERTRANYNEIKSLISPAAAFNFNQKDCQWLKENNDNSKFHTYIGVYDDQLILIVAPLDKDGKEIDLDSYLTTKLTDLKKDITLIEAEVVTTVSKTILSKNLAITKYWKEVDLPNHNEPTITERASVKDIEKWKNEYLDWFYYESSKYRGKNIFRTFTVPFSDVSRGDRRDDKVIAFFGFKHSSIYQTQIPILIFVALKEETGNAEVIRSKRDGTALETNTQDWAHPCPPLCKDDIDYGLLG